MTGYQLNIELLVCNRFLATGTRLCCQKS